MSEFLNIVGNILGGVDISNSDGTPLAHSQPNVLGGLDTFENGHLVDHATPNIYGGLDHHDASGHLSASTHSNLVSAGVDIVDNMQHVIASTHPNILGGIDILNAQNTMEAQLIPDINGFHAKFFK
jgi:hypothetical protein